MTTTNRTFTVWRYRGWLVDDNSKTDSGIENEFTTRHTDPNVIRAIAYRDACRHLEPTNEQGIRIDRLIQIPYGRIPKDWYGNAVHATDRETVALWFSALANRDDLEIDRYRHIWIDGRPVDQGTIDDWIERIERGI